MSVDKDTFRRIMGCFAAGVTVVTTRTAEGSCFGLTATAFSSVSADPPLALVCIDKGAEAHGHILDAGVFAINFLSAGQSRVSQIFATSGADKFGETRWHSGKLGAPILEDVLGCAECRVEHAYDGGDHTIIVGRVEEAEVFDGEPLLYYGRSYGRVAAID